MYVMAGLSRRSHRAFRGRGLPQAGGRAAGSLGANRAAGRESAAISSRRRRRSQPRSPAPSVLPDQGARPGSHVSPSYNRGMASARQIMVGDVPIGGGAPGAVQTMTKTETANL